MVKRMGYAQKTKVGANRSQIEIQTLLRKHGATSFAFGEEGDKGIVMFELNQKRIRFVLHFPSRSDRKFVMTPGGRRERSSDDQVVAWSQACKSKWRALFLSIKAKLVSIEEGISTFEEEFLAHIVINGRNVGDILIPQIEEMTKNGQHRPLLLEFK